MNIVLIGGEKDEKLNFEATQLFDHYLIEAKINRPKVKSDEETKLNTQISLF